jgi:hypothetical protein
MLSFPGAPLILPKLPGVRTINKFCDARVDENEHIYSMRWLARSVNGSRLLQICTMVSSDDQEDCLHDKHFPHCHTPVADLSIVNCGRPFCTYASRFGCLVFSMDTSQLDLANQWERIADLGAYSLILGLKYPFMIRVGGADVSLGNLMRSNRVYTSPNAA